jgi:type IV secretion system protein VirB6
MTCPALRIEENGLASALRAIDCRTGEATAQAFGRLFGANGTLMPALTGLLTLYVAIFAIGLLTGRTRVGVSTLTPRMLTLGLVLTFATSWLAYQNVVWTLATGAPDQIATLIAGTRGSATTAFADRLDTIFTAIAQSNDQAPQGEVAGAAAAVSASSSMFTPQNLVRMSGLMLLLGTVGVLVTAKVALAALLVLGPVFIVMALFPGTRGLFEGWLKAVVAFAMVPLFTVLIGGGAIALITPLIRDALMDTGAAASRSATALFLAACVYSALMVIVARTTTMIVAGWRLPFGAAPEYAPAPVAPPPATLIPLAVAPNAAVALAGERVRSIVAALPAPGGGSAEVTVLPGRASQLAAQILPATPALAAPRADHRLQGVGSRFRTPTPLPSKSRLS